MKCSTCSGAAGRSGAKPAFTCYPAETRVGQEANLFRFGPTWTLNPMKDLEFSASYYALFSPTDTPTLGATQSLAPTNPQRLFTDTGNFRGHFAQAVLKYKFNPHHDRASLDRIALPRRLLRQSRSDALYQGRSRSHILVAPVLPPFVTAG